jgi:hypothetical protein
VGIERGQIYLLLVKTDAAVGRVAWQEILW